MIENVTNKMNGYFNCTVKRKTKSNEGLPKTDMKSFVINVVENVKGDNFC